RPARPAGTRRLDRPAPDQGEVMSRYAKFIAALLGSVATWGVTAGADNGYTQVELWGLLGVVAAALATLSIPTDPPKGEPADPDVSERGYGLIELVVGVLLVIILVVVLLHLL